MKSVNCVLSMKSALLSLFASKGLSFVSKCLDSDFGMFTDKVLVIEF